MVEALYAFDGTGEKFETKFMPGDRFILLDRFGALPSLKANTLWQPTW
jgi:hypothetical protein